MRVYRKNFGLLLISLLALSFNSHFAQAAKKTAEFLKPATVYAYKKQGNSYTPLKKVTPPPVIVKKTGIKIDRNNLYIGGYVVNSTKETFTQVRIYPTFKKDFPGAERIAEILNHDILYLAPGETRRFVIMRPIESVKELLANNSPLSENCILNCRVM